MILLVLVNNFFFLLGSLALPRLVLLDVPLLLPMLMWDWRWPIVRGMMRRVTPRKCWRWCHCLCGRGGGVERVQYLARSCPRCDGDGRWWHGTETGKIFQLTMADISIEENLFYFMAATPGVRWSISMCIRKRKCAHCSFGRKSWGIILKQYQKCLLISLGELRNNLTQAIQIGALPRGFFFLSLWYQVIILAL